MNRNWKLKRYPGLPSEPPPRKKRQTSWGTTKGAKKGGPSTILGSRKGVGQERTAIKKHQTEDRTASQFMQRMQCRLKLSEAQKPLSSY